jgi:histone-arginine methyltransferase CARM1
MDGPIGQKHKQLEFALASVSELSSSSSAAQSKPVVARFSADSGVAELRFQQESESIAAINVDLQTAKVSFSFLFFFFFLFEGLLL